ncbi:uncharacterized protein EDB91DRAFT_799152 [Suillus paluster]|uniref:uncharacterized protein n=1 Tax=Suillus paluster TaxID=48578 RepID=UPI001B8626E6|nr:uncharacterized protein EDB91DRAFT_799152 [Suillus paluster]KAG1729966.1 hypothetical protein EDB91DRAFT_799152 [Suillus paluster]
MPPSLCILLLLPAAQLCCRRRLEQRIKIGRHFRVKIQRQIAITLVVDIRYLFPSILVEFHFFSSSRTLQLHLVHTTLLCISAYIHVPVIDSHNLNIAANQSTIENLS